LTVAGGVRCWGSPYFLGDGSDGGDDNRKSPPAADILTGVATIASSNLTGQTCALTTTGGVRCWGQVDRTNTGTVTTYVSRPTPEYQELMGTCP
jgi:hypothetical protein